MEFHIFLPKVAGVWLGNIPVQTPWFALTSKRHNLDKLKNHIDRLTHTLSLFKRDKSNFNVLKIHYFNEVQKIEQQTFVNIGYESLQYYIILPVLSFL